MKSILGFASIAALFAGSWLTLLTIAPFRRRSTRARLAAYAVSGSAAPRSAQSHNLSDAVRQVLLPIALSLGDRLTRLGGIRTDLPSRLRRAGSEVDPSEFRLKQFFHTLLTAVATLAVLLWWRPAALIWLLALVGLPTLVALIDEQRLESAATRRTERLEAELPIVSEQLAVLLASGMSLGSAMERICGRGHGAVAEDLRDVQMSIRQGSSELDALRAWAQSARSSGVDRLVGVLCLHRETTDLGSLLATESRGIRAEAHRRMIESIERRTQLVWIPVTVATLVPGLILIGVPFVAAMSSITG